MSASGSLASAMLSAAVAERADPARFGRGRTYARDGSVIALTAEPGLLTGRVVGSRPAPYQVTVAVPGLGKRAAELLDEAGQRGINELVPAPRELRVSCSCPDDASMCKHAVAVVLAFAQRVGLEPGLLAQWRSTPTNVAVLRPVTTIDDETSPPVVVGRLERPIRSGGTPHVQALSPEVVAFLGDPDAELPELPELEQLPLTCPRLGEIDLAAVVEEAIDVIRVTYRHRPDR